MSERLIQAVALFVERKVRERLPAERRGMSGPVLSQDAIRQRISVGLEGLIADIVQQALAAPAPPVVTLPDGRQRVLDNRRACRHCSAVTPAATVLVASGEIQWALCQGCASEFGGQH